MTEFTPNDAQKAWAKGNLPDGARINGHLRLKPDPKHIVLPRNLHASGLDLTGWATLKRLPEGLQVRRLLLKGCTALTELPAGLQCFDLDLSGTPIRHLPTDLSVQNRLDLSDCRMLEELPAGLRVGTLVLRNCTRLRGLPDDLHVAFLDLSGTLLETWPTRGAVDSGTLLAQNCTQLRTLPSWLGPLSQLDLRGCSNITHLPANLVVNAWLDIADTAITELPEGARQAQLRWRGITIDERIAFRPERITSDEVLREVNLERRRILMERMGYERFLLEAAAQTLDTDRDAGGERRLLRVPIENDEDLVCLVVQCPSTDRRYALRVPPTIERCHAAAAWIAGFDVAEQYQPLVET